MIAFVEITVTFAAVLALCVFAASRLRLPAGAAPLAVLCLSSLWYALMGCLNLLIPAGVVWFACAAGALAWCVVRRGQLRVRELVTPASVFFVLASLAVIVLFAVRQPVFMEWDEFSFWGIAPKVVKETNQLYTVAPTEMRVISYAPGLVMLDYLFQFLGSAFVPWKVYAAYDILFFAIFAAGLACLERRNWHVAVLGGTFLTLLPYLLTVYMRNIYVDTTYMSSYADVPMGLLFGASLALYFTTREKTPAVLVTACAAIAMTCMSKEMGFALALIAAALICFDLLFVQKKEAVALGRVQGLPVKAGWCAALGASAVVPYVGWVLYRSALTGTSATELGGDQNMSMFQMLFTGIRELLGIGRTERFSRVMGRMWQEFYSTSMSEFRVGALDAQGGIGKYLNGSGMIIVAVILAMLALAWICAGKGRRAGIGWFALWSSLGFAAFYIFTGFTYIYVFHEWQELSDYNRYIYPYYIGWMLTAAVLLCWALRGGRGRILGMGALAALTLFACLRTVSFVQPQLSVVDYPDSYFAGRLRGIETVEQAKSVIREDDKVFYVSIGDDGGDWFRDYYEFYPEVTLDYSFGGGTLAAAMDENLFRDENELGIERYCEASRMQWDEQTALAYAVPGILAMPDYFTEEQSSYYTTHGLTPQVLCRYLTDTGCTVLYLDQIDVVFRTAYGHLFDDGLASGARVYRIEGQGDAMHFVPVPEGGALE